MGATGDDEVERAVVTTAGDNEGEAGVTLISGEGKTSPFLSGIGRIGRAAALPVPGNSGTGPSAAALAA